MVRFEPDRETYPICKIDVWLMLFEKEIRCNIGPSEKELCNLDISDKQIGTQF
jgi:hypothetical protein